MRLDQIKMSAVLVNRAEDIKKIRDKYQVDEKLISEKVTILQEWIRQQPHLPIVLDDDYLERMLLRNKFRVEQTKTKINGYFSLKAQYRKYYLDDYSDFVPSKEVMMGQVCPVVCPTDLCRIIDCQFSRAPNSAKTFNFLHSVQFIMLQMELIQKYDYSLGEHVILDFKYCTADILKKLTVADLAQTFSIYKAAYSGRIVSIHMVNAPSIVSLALGLLKLALPAKLYNRIKVHKKGEDLLQIFPKECLSSDYGGDLPPYPEGMKHWDKVYADHQDFFVKVANTISHEKLRIGPIKYNENFGVDGTFKKLSID